MTNTISPAEAYGQRAEAVSGKRMSWMDTAARLAPLGAAFGIGALGYAENRAQARRDAAWLDGQLAHNEAYNRLRMYLRQHPEIERHQQLMDRRKVYNRMPTSRSRKLIYKRK